MKSYQVVSETGTIISESTYKAAKAVAETVEAHFADHLNAARQNGDEELATEPTASVIEAIIDITFWSSLRREEGRSPKISIAYLPPEKAGTPLMFERRLPLTPNVLTKLGPAVERSGIHLGIWNDGDELYVWGTTHAIPGFCFVLEVIEPGLLVIKHRRTDGFGKFVNVAVLKGDQIKIIDETGSSLPDCPALVTSLLGFNTPSSWNDSLNILVQLAVSMRAHGRGGSLLVVPAGDESWRESIVHPITYPVAPAFNGLADVINQKVKERGHTVWKADLNREVDNIGGLTAVDGATIITDQYELLAFGAKIGRVHGGSQIEEIIVTEPVLGGTPTVIHPAQDGGTRHLSAAQFVYDQRNAIALVASQDGRFTVFSWSPCDAIVHAHRVDILLL